VLGGDGGAEGGGFASTEQSSANWGRGSPGTVRLDSYRRRDEADAAERCSLRRRVQHDYRAI
jgi:hypothetical protein